MTNVLIVEARFYSHIADMQFEGAMKALANFGAQVDRITVPGALEISARDPVRGQGRGRRGQKL